jgi:hypothetical protein
MTDSPVKEDSSQQTDYSARLTPSEWRRRRFRLDVSLILLFGCLIYVLIPGGEVEVDKAAVIPLVAGIVGLIGSYVFGAVWDDQNHKRYMAQIWTHPSTPYYAEQPYLDPGMN